MFSSKAIIQELSAVTRHLFLQFVLLFPHRSDLIVTQLLNKIVIQNFTRSAICLIVFCVTCWKTIVLKMFPQLSLCSMHKSHKRLEFFFIFLWAAKKIRPFDLFVSIITFTPNALVMGIYEIFGGFSKTQKSSWE